MESHQQEAERWLVNWQYPSGVDDHDDQLDGVSVGVQGMIGVRAVKLKRGMGEGNPFMGCEACFEWDKQWGHLPNSTDNYNDLDPAFSCGHGPIAKKLRRWHHWVG